MVFRCRPVPFFRSGKCSLFLVLFALLLSANVKAESKLVLTGPAWPPYVVPEQVDQGFATEIVQQSLKAVGRGEPRIELKPWRRVLWNAQNQSVDGLIGVWFSPERQFTIAFSEPYFTSSIVAIFPKNRAFSIQQPADLFGKQIIHRSGARFGLGFDRNETLRKIAVDSTANVVSMIAKGRGEVGVEDRLLVEGFLKTHPELADQVRLSKVPLFTQSLYFGVVRGRPGAHDLLADFNRGLRKIRQTGIYHDILQRHGVDHSPAEPVFKQPRPRLRPIQKMVGKD